MMPVYPDPISEFGIADSGFTNVLFFGCYVNEVSTVTCQFGF